VLLTRHNTNKTLQTSNPGYRIAIIGNAGGGKTTLSLKLGRDFSLPIVHIDNLQWDKSWKRKSELMFQKAHNQLMNLDL
jgi:adenylate kinase family enzyme